MKPKMPYRTRAFFLGLTIGALLYVTNLGIFNTGHLSRFDQRDLNSDLRRETPMHSWRSLEHGNVTAGKKAREIKRRRKEEKEREKEKNKKAKRGSLPILQPSSGYALQNIDYATYSPEDRAILENRVGMLTERARAVSRVCQSNPIIRNEPVKEVLVWDLKHTPGIVWCPVYKVASTSWMRNFLRLAHFNENNPLIPRTLSKEKQDKLRFKVKYGATHNRVFEIYPRPETADKRDRAMRQSFRVIIVRHPFTRILSAYRDKIAKQKPRPAKFGFKELQRSIVTKYRPHNSKDKSSVPTFPEFVQYLIDSTSNFTSASAWNENVNCWLPYWVHCSVCSYDYNIIMKLETLQDDEQFLITLSRLEELKGRDNWVHLNGVSSTEVATQYYKEITRHQMKELYKRYEPDFRLFQYDIDNYLAIAKDSEK